MPGPKNRIGWSLTGADFLQRTAAAALVDDRDRLHLRRRHDSGHIGRSIERDARRIMVMVPGIGLNHRNVIDVEAGVGKSVGIAMKLLLIGGYARRL